MPEDTWIVSEIEPLTSDDTATIVREAGALIDDETRGAGAPRLSVVLRHAACNNVQKLFGGAEVRLDALVVHGPGGPDDGDDAYMPGTFRFPNVRDRDVLPIDPEFGLLIFDGRPSYFLDVFLIVSRDRKDSDDLAALLRTSAANPDVVEATTNLVALATATPTAAVVAGAVAAAATLGDIAYQVVKSVSPKTIGMYRGSFLQFKHGFGIGRHPKEPGDSFTNGDLEFWFEIVYNDVDDEAYEVSDD